MPLQVDLYHQLSGQFCRHVTRKYSTSFSLAIRLLSPAIRQDIYNIYGFVRIADEIVDSFHDYPKEQLLDRFEMEVYSSFEDGISLNPVINSFRQTARKYDIPKALIKSFMDSMRKDLYKQTYTVDEYHDYIYGSADVVGLMCLRVFVQGDNEKYEALRHPAMKLGSAFQKVNFLRDMKDDMEVLQRTYFPGVDPDHMTDHQKADIIHEVRKDLLAAYEGIRRLPADARLGVSIAYRYYKNLLEKIEKTKMEELRTNRVRIPNTNKLLIIAGSYIQHKISWI